MPPAASAPLDIGPAVRTRLAGFVRTLRDNGFRIGLAETRDALAILGGPDPADRRAVRTGFRALFAGRRSDWDAFDTLFDAYWSGHRVRTRVKVSGASAAHQTTLRSLAASGAPVPGDFGPAIDLASGTGEADAAPHGRNEGASRAERLSRTDLRHIADPEELAEAHALAARLARAMQARLTRRDRARMRGPRLDLRRTIRRSLSTGGEPVDLVRRQPKTRPLRLVLIVDASGSMEFYTGFFLRFVHGCLDSFRRADAFLFHTRLVHVSDALKERDAARALDRLGLMAEGVGGGTRIGDSLADFNRWHAERVLRSRCCVMIFSDGYDTGEPDRLGAEMAALRRRCRRIVWLNPLLGREGYEPSARGMAAALPHVDLFASARTLGSLAALEPYLARL